MNIEGIIMTFHVEDSMKNFIREEIEISNYNHEEVYLGSQEGVSFQIDYEDIDELHDHAVKVMKSKAYGYKATNIVSMPSEQMDKILEMVEWFLADEGRQNISDGTCMYSWDANCGKKGCAVGYLLGEEIAEKWDKAYPNGVGFDGVGAEVFNLAPEIVTKNSNLMSELQNWHDDLNSVFSRKNIRDVFEQECSAYECARLENLVCKYE